MSACKISVIIPVFNSENTIKRCIDSIRGQSFSNWELLLIDDGSTDRSGEICNVYAAMDSRIRSIHKKNGGVSSARNRGIEDATGEYIMFVDSDDWIETDALETLYNAAIEHDAEIVLPRCVGEFYYANGVLEKKVPDSKEFEIVVNKDKLHEEFRRLWSVACFYSVCGRLFSLDLIKCNSILFDENIYVLEDMCFVLHLLPYANRTMHVNKIIYHYTVVDVTSYSRKRGYDIYLQSMPYVQKTLIGFITENNIEDKRQYIDFIMGYWVSGIDFLMTVEKNKARRYAEIMKCAYCVRADGLYDKCTKEYLKRQYDILFKTDNIKFFILVNWMKKIQTDLKNILNYILKTKNR